MNVTDFKNYETFKDTMQEIINEDFDDSFDKNEEELNSYEKDLNELMNNTRNKLRNTYIDDGKKYPPAMLFYKARKAIDNDPLINIFKQMPKGGNLHIHTGACADVNCLIDLLQNNPDINNNVYIYLGETTKTVIYGTFFYLNQPPDHVDFLKLSTALEINRIDISEIINLLTVSSDKYVGDRYMWDVFHDCLNRVSTILNVRIIYEKYYECTIRTLIKDNIDYAELRVLIRPVLSDDNTNDLHKALGNSQYKELVKTDSQKIELVQKILKAYQKVVSETNSDFKLKVIISGSRSASQSIDDTLEHLKLTSDLMTNKELKDNGYHFVIGYDIVSEEDKGKKTEEYAKMLIDNKIKVPLYFHDGESRWGDNTNVHAAYLLGSKRIGHGLNIHNFPKLIDKLIEEDIALEVCPVSNQILGYVDDFRIHPIGTYLKRGLQCVIASDDPQLFNYSSLAYDFWVLYYGLFFNLKTIKKLIKNSYIYSALSNEEKEDKLQKWQIKWDAFVNDAVIELSELK